MLHLYQSNRLEHLAEMMLTLQAAQPLTSPLASEEIVVQSQGMRRYITQYMAKKHGIAANLHFSLPAGLSWQLMRRLLNNIPELSPFATEVIRWRLFSLFQSAQWTDHNDFQAAYQVLRAYLSNGDYATYQLAGEIADIFDQYLVYRPDWIEAWSKQQQPNELKNNPTAHWQAQIWRFLDNGSTQTPHRAALWRQLMEKLAEPQVAVAPRYCVFGIATLAPMYLTLLKQLALHSDVHIFALNPSAEFWGNVIEPATILASGDINLSHQGHPLLASLGKQGRDFFNQLADANTQTDLDSYTTEEFSGSLLHRLQHDIQTQTLPETTHQQGFANTHLTHLETEIWSHQPERKTAFQAACTSAQILFEQAIKQAKTPTQHEQAQKHYQQHLLLAQMDADNSIQIHSAHSPLRELHILKDHLLQQLAQDPTLQPHDIAILTPNIEPYVPFIEAIFGKHCPDERPLPYSIADIKRSTTQPLMQAVAQLLNLLISRFEADKLLQLLEHDTILHHFKLTRADLPLIHDTITQLNIHWGADAAQRAEYGDNDDLFTWQQGLNRLIAGWLLPENNNLWHNISPFTMRPDFMPTMANFANLINTLIQARQTWQQNRGITDWINQVRQLIHNVFDLSADEQTAMQQLEQSLSQWQTEAQLAEFHAPIPANIAIAHIQRFLSSQSEAGFLRGGITFCSMVPMRSLPFKILCLLGLNDGDFPRNTSSAPFDLISKHHRTGDRARRDDDRYLFLEAILSARQTLYLSYIGKDIRTNEARAPSVLLNELIDTLAAQMGITPKYLLEKWVIQHPLQAFSRQYFSGSPKYNSARQDYAQALNQPLNTSSPFINTLPTTPELPNTPETEQQNFIQFWRNPVKSYLRQQFNWQEPFTAATQEAAEPFEPSQPRIISDAYLNARRKQEDFTQTTQRLYAQSQLPAGILGELTQQHYALAAKQLDGSLLQQPYLPTVSGSLKLTAGKFHYHLNHLTAQGQLLTADQFLRSYNQSARLSASDKIEIMLLHLIYCATPLSGNLKTTHFISLDKQFSLPEINTKTAQNILNEWLTAYHTGQTAPLPFFPRVNLAAVLAMTGNEKAWGKHALPAAAKVYHNGYKGFAQADYPEIQLVYGRNASAEPPYQSTLFQHLSENLLFPLQDWLNLIEKANPE